MIGRSKPLLLRTALPIYHFRVDALISLAYLHLLIWMVAGKIRPWVDSAHYVKCTLARLPIALGMTSFQERGCLLTPA